MPAERRVRRQQRRVGIVHRDSQKTRARILKAATAEFAAKGFAGARVARIAHRARVNRAMLYYYYGHKRRLFEETLRRATDRVLQVTWNAEDPVASVLAWFRVATRDPRVVRLLQWESLEGRSVGAEATGQRHNAFTSLARVFGDDVHACHPGASDRCALAAVHRRPGPRGRRSRSTTTTPGRAPTGER